MRRGGVRVGWRNRRMHAGGWRRRWAVARGVKIAQTHAAEMVICEPLCKVVGEGVWAAIALGLRAAAWHFVSALQRGRDMLHRCI